MGVEQMKTKENIITICSLVNKPCRHAGVNMNVVRIPVVIRKGAIDYPTGKEETHLRPDDRGQYCNDMQRYIQDMRECPHQPRAIKVLEGSLVLHGTRQTTLDW
jgi:hypothetical protein